MKNIIRKTLSALLTAISCLLVVLCLWAVFSVSAGKAPMIFNHSVLIVQTGSMEPVLPVGSVLIIRKTDFNSIQVGDIISFYSTDPALNGRINTHEVIQRDGDLLITKGKANSLVDNYPVSADNILGKVVFCSPLAGKFISAIKNPYVFPLLIIIPLLYIIVSSALNIRRLMKQHEQNIIEEMLQENEQDSEEAKDDSTDK